MNLQKIKVAYQTAKYHFRGNRIYSTDNKPLSIETLNIIQK